MTDISAASPSVADMLRGFSIEVNPSESKIIDAAPVRLIRAPKFSSPGFPGPIRWIRSRQPQSFAALVCSRFLILARAMSKAPRSWNS